jgi:putative DNA primase/helicase
MNQDFRVWPTHKLWLGANHKPKVNGTDNAIWRRILLIPFSSTIPKNEQDRSLPEKLREELPGILAWAVRGCIEWN